MKILLYGINFWPELTGIGKYTGEMSFWLNDSGHEVKVITANPYYPEWKIFNGYKRYWYSREQENGVDIKRVPIYVPASPKTSTRLIHLFSFALFSIPLLLKNIFWKPDIIIAVEPTFFCTPGTLIFSKLTSSRSVLHIQDYELDAMLGLGMSNNKFIAKVARKLEKFVMKKFDAISSISFKMLDIAKQKSPGSKYIYFPNWVDVDKITPNGNRKKFLDRWNISADTKVVLYSGNMGKKQGLELIINAAKVLGDKENILFILVGDGVAKSRLVKLSENMNLTNVAFYPLQAYDDLTDLMALGDIHLVVQRKGAADAVLPSKLTTILSAGGTALITTEPDTELGRLCIDNPDIAYAVEPEDLDEFIDKLTGLIDNVDVKNRKANSCARKYAVDNIEKDVVLSRFSKDLEKLISE